VVILGYAGTLLSIIGLIVLFATWRKPARIRNWLDAARLLITGGVVAGMMLVLGVTTPIWLAAAAAALGLALGAGQGIGLDITVTDKGLMARRTMLGLLATGGGVLVMQGASLLNRSGVVRLGTLLSFLSIGVTAGLIGGRGRGVRRARQDDSSSLVRAAAMVSVALVALAATFTVFPARAEAQEAPCRESVSGWSLDNQSTQDSDSSTSVRCDYRAPTEIANGSITIFVQWLKEFDPEFDECGVNRVGADGGSVTWFASETTSARGTVRIFPPGVEIDQASVDSAVAEMLAFADAASPSCAGALGEPPPGGFQAADSVVIPGFGADAGPGVVELLGGIDTTDMFGDVSLAEMSTLGLVGIAYNQATVRVPLAGGAIEGTSTLVWRWDDESLDRALSETLSEEFGGDPGEEYVPRPCFYLAALNYDIEGRWDAATGQVSGRIQLVVAPSVVVSGCEFTNFDNSELTPRIDFTGTFDGSVIRIRSEVVPDSPNSVFSLAASIDGLAAENLGVTPPEGVFAAESGLIDVGGVGLAGADDGGEEAGDGDGFGDSTEDTAVDESDEAFWEDLFADDVEIDEDDAAWAALLGMLGISAIGLTSLLDSGAGLSDLLADRTGVSAFDDPVEAERFAEELRRRQSAEGLDEGAVIDEFGAVLQPDEDGLFVWETADGSERVSRGEILERIGEARAADAARAARHEAIVAEQIDAGAAEQRQADLRQQSLDDDQQAAAELAEDLADEAARDRTRQRVADVLQERADTGGWDAIAERLEQGDSLTREELQTIRDGLDRLTAEQGAFDPATSGSYAEDLWNEFASDAATAQEQLARVVDQAYGPGAGWVVRNPTTTARIGLGVATGGFSEGVIAPHEMMQAMEAAAAEAHAQGRDLTYGEAVMAAVWQAGPGMLIGKAGELGIAAAGPAVARWGGEALESLGRSVDEFFESAGRSVDEAGEIVVRDGSDVYARSVAEQSRRASTRSVRNSAELADDLGLRWTPDGAAGGVRSSEAGTVVPQSRMSEDYGMSESGYRQLRGAVQRNDVSIQVRSRSAGALERIEAGAVPKPAPIKIKTGGELDQYIGMSPAQRDLVPWKPDGDWIAPVRDTPPPNWPPGRPWDDDAYDAVMGRYRQRSQEFIDNREAVQELFSGGQARHNPDTGNLEWNTTGGTRTDPGDFRPVAGDHDIFDIEVNVPTEVLDMGPEEVERYVRQVQGDVLNDLSGPPLGVQHGAHMQWTVPSTRQAQTINGRILDSHRPPVAGADGDALLRVSKDMPAHIAYYQGTSLTLDEVDRIFRQ
jgi:hypothetical protein